jgi:peroxiredoxin
MAEGMHQEVQPPLRRLTSLRDKGLMNALIITIILQWVVIGAGCWLGWQLLRQNGRMLLRLDELERRLDEWEFGERDQQAHGEAPADERTSRFGSRSLARSKIKRDGLKAGTPAPNFRLPRLDGGELSLDEYRDRCLLLVFSDPHCGPCDALAPQLEKFHCEHPEIALVMISRREPKENRAKVKEHGLTFAVVLQQQWEISRLYGMFATPVGYLIDEAGIIVNDAAVGAEAIQALMLQAKDSAHEPEAALR